jgi:hypothetical protein
VLERLNPNNNITVDWPYFSVERNIIRTYGFRYKFQKIILRLRIVQIQPLLHKWFNIINNLTFIVSSRRVRLTKRVNIIIIIVIITIQFTFSNYSDIRIDESTRVKLYGQLSCYYRIRSAKVL